MAGSIQRAQGCRFVIQTDAIDWSHSPTGVASKILRHDAISGAKTLMLRAPPRGPGNSAPHFHSSDEEIFNLGQTMQFDRGRPLYRYGFARYRAGMVHGDAVDLPHGYELLVRYDRPSNLTYSDTRSIPVAPENKTSISALTKPQWVAAPWEGSHPLPRVLALAANTAGAMTAWLCYLPAGTWIQLPAGSNIEFLGLGGAGHSGPHPWRRGTYGFAADGPDRLVAATRSLLFLRLERNAAN